MNGAKTAHKVDCKMAFGRKDTTCPRCQELIAGDAPRRGWGPPVRSLEHGTVPKFYCGRGQFA